ncbi:NAD(P)H-dependent FMN reductase [Chryseolinea serpens]|uniref:NAD(P)H-dependent FMN reductase n=1 Tax=Chryseolinea serpens TaxID=947013 RepID=A0A1M5JI07_9BACT|nr:NAD(P)H-dependent oxidoreductase [Chryseolinea serpens]SHG40224.1 NAD(P)H-dependent FMN reductase [Chryseolinea serpens]
MKEIKILALVGSLRATSSNHVVVKHLARLAPDEVDFQVYDGMGKLPLFDDSETTPPAVQDLRDKLSAADGILICTPEYAFGVPGALKNALDWTVSSAELVNKPVALITASTGGEKAHAALLYILEALSARVADDARLLISFIRAKLKNGEVSDGDTLRALNTVLTAIIREARLSKAEASSHH